MENFSTINPTIKNILTLRYDPTQKPILPKKTWKDFTSQQDSPSIDFIEKLIVNTIRKIIGKNTNSITIALSGGVDSTLILTILKNFFPSITVDAISIKFANSIDESDKAAKISSHFGINHHIVHLDNYLSELPKAISIIELPYWDLHWYHVVKKAQTLSKYLASGDGGDELFGGYTFRYKKFKSLINLNSSTIEKTNAYLLCHERDSVPDQENLFGKQARFSWKFIYDTLISYFDNPLDALNQVLLADYNGKLLYNFSLVNSKIHTYFKIKSIAPLLSEELISYATHIPLRFKYDEKSNIGKLPLRQILLKHGTDTFVTEEKLGFNVNTLNLWKSHGHRICKNYLTNSRIVQDNWINKEWIDRYIDQENLDIRYINKFLGLLAFEIWYRLFITKEMNPNTILH